MSTAVKKFYDAELRPPRGGWGVVINGIPFDGNSESMVFDSIKRWRQNNSTFVSDLDIQREMWTQYVARQPERFTVDGKPDWKSVEGPKRWFTLHGRAADTIERGSIDETSERAFLAEFTSTISCDDCRQHWIGFVQASPVDLSSPDAYFNWTVDRHNDVNGILFKRQLSYAEARAIHIA